MGALTVPTNLVEMPRQFDVKRAALETRLGNGPAKAILVRITEAGDARGFAFIGSRRICAEMEIADRTLDRVLQVFERMGLVGHVVLTKAEREALRREEQFRSEEFQVNLAMLGRDLSTEFGRLYRLVSGKAKPAAEGEAEAGTAPVKRGKAKPGPKVVSAADVSETDNCAAETINCVSETNPPDPLLGETPLEPLGTPSHAQGAAVGIATRGGEAEGDPPCPQRAPAEAWVSGRALDAASALVCSTLWPKIIAVSHQGLIREAMERECVRSGESPQRVHARMVASWHAMLAGGGRFSAHTWFGQGHWLHAIVPVVPSTPARVGMYCGESETPDDVWAALHRRHAARQRLTRAGVAEGYPPVFPRAAAEGAVRAEQILG